METLFSTHGFEGVTRTVFVQPPPTPEPPRRKPRPKKIRVITSPPPTDQEIVKITIDVIKNRGLRAYNRHAEECNKKAKAMETMHEAFLKLRGNPHEFIVKKMKDWKCRNIPLIDR